MHNMDETGVTIEMEDLEPFLADRRDGNIVERDDIKDSLVALKVRGDLPGGKEYVCPRMEVEYYGPLHHAAACGFTAYLEYLLTEHPVNSRAHDNSTPLHLASRNLQLECVKLLLDQGDVEVDAVDDNGLTPLHSAGMDASYDVDDEDEKPERSLFIRRSGSALPVVELLIQKGAKIPQDDGRKITTFIHRAVIRRDVALFKHVLENSWDILRLRDEDNCNVLYIIVVLQDLNMLKMIMSYTHFVKESLNEPVHSGVRPLSGAVVGGWVEGVRELLQAGAQIVGKDLGEYNVLHWAAGARSPEVIDMILAQATKNRNIFEFMNAPCSTGETPIFFAVGSCDRQCVYNFLKWGADAKRRADGNYNLIHQAIMGVPDGRDGQNPLDMLYYLLEYPELKLLLNEVTTKNTNEGAFGTPANIAAWLGDLGCVKALVEKYEADFTKPLDSECYIDDKEIIKGRNWTPLHSAAYKGNVEVIEYIINANSYTLRAITVDGWTPLHVAAWNRQEGSVRCLLKLGASLAETTTDEHKSLAVEMILVIFSDPQKLLMDIFDSCIIDSKDTIDSHVEIDYSLVMLRDDRIFFDVLKELASDTVDHKVIDEDEMIFHPLIETLVNLKVEEMFYSILMICLIHFMFTAGFYFMTVSWKNYDSTPFIDVLGLILLGYWMYFSLYKDILTANWRQLFHWRTWPWFLCLLMAMAMTVSHLTSPCGLSDYSTWVLVPMVLLATPRVFYCINPITLDTIFIMVDFFTRILAVHAVVAFLFVVVYMYASNKNDPFNDSWMMTVELFESVIEYVANAVNEYISKDVLVILNGLYVLVPLVATYFLRNNPNFGVLTNLFESKAKQTRVRSIVEQAKLLERMREFWVHNSTILTEFTQSRKIRVYHSKKVNSKIYGCPPIGDRVWECVANWYIKQEDPARKKDKDLFSTTKGIKQSEDSSCPCIKINK